MAKRVGSGVYRAPEAVPVAALEAYAAHAGWRYVYFDLGAVADKAALLELFATRLSFPDYFGRNWDALFDCLQDYGSTAAGELWVFDGAGDYGQRCGPDLTMLVDILQHVSEHRNEEPDPAALWMTLRGSAPPLTALPELAL